MRYPNLYRTMAWTVNSFEGCQRNGFRSQKENVELEMPSQSCGSTVAMEMLNMDLWEIVMPWDSWSLKTHEFLWDL